MAGGQVITSEQGSLTQSLSLALVGIAIAVSAGTLVASTPADIEVTGSESTFEQGSTSSAVLVPLRSRKVGGGAATRTLTGVAFGSALTAPTVGFSRTPSGQLATLSQGSFGKTRTVALTGSAITVSTGIVSSGASTFPLSVQSNRYLVTATGTPFLLHGDTVWSLPAMASDAEVDQIIDNRAAKGFTALMIEAPVFRYTETGGTANVDGVQPFTSMTGNWNWVLNNTYWNRVDRIVNRCKANNMAVVINPAYIGFGADGFDGCAPQLTGTSAGTLQTYGAALANRYTQGNVIWSMGGDEAGDSTLRDKQWNIVTGIRSVRTTDIVTAHASSGEEAFPFWSGYTGFNLNWTYTYETDGQYAYIMGATAYARNFPHVFFEGKYENSTGATLAMMRRQSYTSMLAGACGQFFGNHPLWHMNSPEWSFDPPSGTWQDALESTGSQQQVHVKALFSAYAWWRLQPQTGTGLVTTSLSSNANRITPALANDASFAMIYFPAATTATVNMAALTLGSVRARTYNVTNGAYTLVSGSPFAASGTRNFTIPSECVLVLDADPGTVSLSMAWDANPTNSVTGYNLYRGSSSGSYTFLQSLGLVTSTVIQNPPGVWYFAITAVSANGESGFSNEINT